MNTKPLRFIRRGEVVNLNGVPPSRTLLEVLREDLHACGTKEGCGEGDCGACTVVLGEARDGKLHYSAINSCIRMAHSVHGMAVWTTEDLPAADGSLHPVQQAMADCHSSQCGFCTPGFVMSLFAQYQIHTAQGKALSRQQAQEALSGNLCRCTGYRPILDAAQAMQKAPVRTLDEARLLSQLKQLAKPAPALQDANAYQSPQTLKELLRLKARQPQAQLVAGCTDAGLWVTKQHREFASVIDTTRVAELRRIEHYPHHIAIGAAVSLTDAYAALMAQWPQVQSFAHRFAGLPVRNSGTLGGNVANGSPIGDSMPLLIALGANVVLMSERGHREMPLEALYTGYRQNVMAKDEVLAWIKVPKAGPGEFMRVYKISKRQEDDISAVCLAVCLQLENGIVQSASIGAGGVAATPMRAVKTEAALLGLPWSAQAAQRAGESLQAEFSPISDMRASAAYRRQVLGNLMRRFWLESQGTALASLDDPALQGEAA